MDEDWKFGGDDAGITTTIREGRAGTAMAPFKDILNDEQIRQVVFYLREQAGSSRASRKPRSTLTERSSRAKSRR